MVVIDGLMMKLLLAGQVAVEPAAAPIAAIATPAPAEPTVIPSAVPAEPTLSPGRYQIFLEYVIEVDVPVLGTQTSTTNTVLMMDVVAEDHQRFWSGVTCSIVTGGTGFITRTPPASLRVLTLGRMPLEITAGRLRADLGKGSIGYDGSQNKILPKTDDDPRIRDTDGDGKPGMRMELVIDGIGAFPINVVSSAHGYLDGRLTKDGGARGKAISIQSEERVLSGLPVPSPPMQDKRFLPSTFRMVRVADDASCP
jgi:hypothetical protein